MVWIITFLIGFVPFFIMFHEKPVERVNDLTARDYKWPSCTFDIDWYVSKRALEISVSLQLPLKLRFDPPKITIQLICVGSMVEWLKHRTHDQHDLSSKPTCAILLCSWERHFMALSPAWWS